MFDPVRNYGIPGQMTVGVSKANWKEVVWINQTHESTVFEHCPIFLDTFDNPCSINNYIQ